MDDGSSIFNAFVETEVSDHGLEVSTEIHNCQQVDSAKKTQDALNSSSVTAAVAASVNGVPVPATYHPYPDRNTLYIV